MNEKSNNYTEIPMVSSKEQYSDLPAYVEVGHIMEQPVGETQIQTTGVKPDTHLLAACISTLLCWGTLPIGVFAIFFAAKSDRFLVRGHREECLRWAKRAKRATIMNIVLGTIVYTIIAIILYSNGFYVPNPELFISD